LSFKRFLHFYSAIINSQFSGIYGFEAASRLDSGESIFALSAMAPPIERISVLS
jgi:hypothetical protein